MCTYLCLTVYMYIYVCIYLRIHRWNATRLSTQISQISLTPEKRSRSQSRFSNPSIKARSCHHAGRNYDDMWGRSTSHCEFNEYLRCIHTYGAVYNTNLIVFCLPSVLNNRNILNWIIISIKILIWASIAMVPTFATAGTRGVADTVRMPVGYLCIYYIYIPQYTLPAATSEQNNRVYHLNIKIGTERK